MVLNWQRFCQGVIGRNLRAFLYFLFTQNVLLPEFLVQTGNQNLRIYPCVKFKADWTKDEGVKI